MGMQKYFINNRYGLKIAIIVERPWFSRGTALVMHGLGATKEQPHVAACAKAFRDYRYTTVRFDTTNSFGESGGDFGDATLASSFEDLQDVMAWLRIQPWFRRPLILAGHSLGGMCTAMYTEQNPGHVGALAQLSSAVSGAFLIEAMEKSYPAEVKRWRETGEVVFAESVPRYIRMLLPTNLESFLAYDALPQASELSMPAVFIVGESDWLTPPNVIQKLYDAVPGKKELHIVPGAPHTFREQAHIDKVTEIMAGWIRTLAL